MALTPRRRARWQAPANLSCKLASVMHLVDSLARMRLVASGQGAASVAFKYNGRRLTLLRGDAALAARRHVAATLDCAAISRLRRRMDADKPDFSLMQQLYDAGLGVCPVSGMPVLDPSKCGPALQHAIWRAYCGVARSVDSRHLGGTSDALDDLSNQLREYVRQWRRGAQMAGRSHYTQRGLDSSESGHGGSATRRAGARDRPKQTKRASWRRTRRVIALSSDGLSDPDVRGRADGSASGRSSRDGRSDTDSHGSTDNPTSDCSSRASRRRRRRRLVKGRDTIRGGDESPADGNGRPEAPETPPTDADALAAIQALADLGDERLAALSGGGDAALDSDVCANGEPAHVLGRNAAMLARLHPLDGDAHLTFVEETHAYTVWGTAVDRSVTALVSALFETFDPERCTLASFERWARDPQSKYYDTIERTRASGGTDTEAAAAIRLGWADLGAEAARLGTALHLYAELVLNGVAASVPSELSKEVEQFEVFRRSAFVRDAGLVPFRTELSVAYRDGPYAVTAGQIDCLYRARDGRMFMIDFKRVAAKHSLLPWERHYNKYGSDPVDAVPDAPFWRYSLQLSLYNVMCVQVCAREPRLPSCSALVPRE